MEKVNKSYSLVLRTYKLKRIPFTMKFHPTQQNSFLVGSNNKKILQFDTNTGTKQFEYSQHSGTINTIDFI
jgi:pre-mRNA-processing factor 17